MSNVFSFATSEDGAGILKIMESDIARGEIRVIGATTFEEYRKYIESDKAFARRLQKIVVDEPDEEESIAILRGIKSRFESHHRIKILDEAVVASVKLSIRYITDRFLPDKAIDLLDEAASRMRMERSSVPEALDDLTRTIRCKEIEKQAILQDGLSNNQLLASLDLEIAELREKENTLNAKWRNERQQFELIQTLQDELERYIINREQEENLNHYDQAAQLQRRIDEVESRIDELIHEFSEENNPLLKMSLDENDIRKVITNWTGIPVEELGEDEADQLLHLETNLQSSVIGQDEAIHSVANIVRRNRMGFSDSNKPIGSFLFLGTTGVGKTELAKALARYLFHSQDLIIRIDMSEYQQEYSVSRLFGAPPGYVGYDQGGQLTEAVRRKPYSVILLDEIEKAHPKVFETLLQVLDDGRMTDGQGHVVDFKNTIIIMTSNLGAMSIIEHIGEGRFAEMKPVIIQQIIQLLKQRVSSEFVNRIDEILLFNPLSKEAIREIAILQLTRLRNKLSKNGINITIEDSAELQIKNIENLVSLEARNANASGAGQITIRDLIKSSLRMRPERIIVGECRGGEALDMLQAMNTGHDGSLSTGHANSTEDMLSRLETMVLQGASGLPLEAIRQQIASAVDIIIHLSRLRDKSRKTVEIAEVVGYENGKINLNPLYVFEENEYSTMEKVSGSLVRTSNKFKNDYKLKLSGYNVDF